MKTKLEPRKTQTRVKHEILARYLATWGGIVVNGLSSRRQQQDWRFIYVDCFSSIGQYAGEHEDNVLGRSCQPVYGSPVIGIHELDKLAEYARKKGIGLQTNTILIEEKPTRAADLQETLRHIGLGPRVRTTTDFPSLSNGEIAVVCGNCLNMADDLIAYTTGGCSWAFYLLDPYGPSGIPHDFVQAIIRQEHHDVMINFIYEDLLRKTGMCLRNDLEAPHQQLVDYWTLAFGSEQWKDIARRALLGIDSQNNWYDSLPNGIFPDGAKVGFSFTDEQMIQVKEWEFVNAYKDVLQSMDPDLAIKLVDLRFCDRERTMFYLFLTTHDATGALSLNKILYDAKYLEFELRNRLGIAKKTTPPPGQLSLFDIEPTVPEPSMSSRPTTEEVAGIVLRQLAGRSVTKREVYRELVDELFFPTEVDKALRLLRDTSRAHFEGQLQHKTRIDFLNI